MHQIHVDLDKNSYIIHIDKGILPKFADIVKTYITQSKAAIITNSIVTPGPELRIQTSKVAKSFAAEKLSGDPDGTLLQRKVRVGTLGL